MSIEVKISKKPITYKKAMLFMNKRVEEVKSVKDIIEEMFYKYETKEEFYGHIMEEAENWEIVN